LALSMEDLEPGLKEDRERARLKSRRVAKREQSEAVYVAEQRSRSVPEFHPELGSSGEKENEDTEFQGVQGRVESAAQGGPDTQADRRGPPTDRPPDPPPCKGAFRGSLQERAGSRHADQLSSARDNNGLSGNAALLEKIQIKVQSPSNQRHASEAGLPSQDCSRTRRVRSWRHTSGGRFRAKGYVCDKLSPSRNPGRNLFPRGVFLSPTESAGSMAQRECKATCSHPIAGA
jgi:hypothetical protein